MTESPELLDAPTVAFPASGLVPAIVQDALDGRILMLAYIDAEALAALAKSWSRKPAAKRARPA